MSETPSLDRRRSQLLILSDTANEQAPADVAAKWERIHRLIDGIFVDTAKSLNTPATESELAELEAVLGFELPVDLRSSLAIHNGQTDLHRVLGISLDGTLLHTRLIAHEWQTLTEVDNQLARTEPDWEKIEWWNRRWIPTATGGDGDYLCVNMDADLAPVGQLVYHVHDNPFHHTKWPSFAAWLEEIATKLERNQTEMTGCSVRVRDEHELDLQAD